MNNGAAATALSDGGEKVRWLGGVVGLVDPQEWARGSLSLVLARRSRYDVDSLALRLQVRCWGSMSSLTRWGEKKPYEDNERQ